MRWPSARRNPGTVGPAVGVDLAIMDEAGRLLAPGSTGQIVIRGRGVTAGYENNPQANANAFVDGWFRNGDQGVIDCDGYLSITGRLKEIINRGGEKISPREIDEVLMDHPAAAQAVSRCRTTALAKTWVRRSSCDPAKRRRNGNCAVLPAGGLPTSGCRGGSSSSARFRRAPPASCSALGWRHASA